MISFPFLTILLLKIHELPVRCVYVEEFIQKKKLKIHNFALKIAQRHHQQLTIDFKETPL